MVGVSAVPFHYTRPQSMQLGWTMPADTNVVGAFVVVWKHDKSTTYDVGYTNAFWLPDTTPDEVLHAVVITYDAQTNQAVPSNQVDF